MSEIEIIAELAQGFEGHPAQARLLIHATASAGANAAKFQLVYADELAAPGYQHYDLFRSLEMDDEEWVELSAYAATLGIALQLDVFGPRSLSLAERIGAAAIKLHGTDLANVGLLTEVARSSAPRVLLGAGGSWAGELDEALRILAAKPVVVLLGFQGYPTPTETNQIARVRRVLDHIRRAHPSVSVGFADHAAPETSLRYALAATAIGAGATVIEKHLTLGRAMQLEDHESALNPDEFAEFVAVARACGAALGAATDADDFGMSESEKAYRAKIRRHVVARRPLAAGTTMTPADLTLKRTAAEHALLDPGRAYNKTLRRDLNTDDPVLFTDID